MQIFSPDETRTAQIKKMSTEVEKNFGKEIQKSNGKTGNLNITKNMI